MKLLVLLVVATAIYFLIIRPLLIGPVKRETMQDGLGDMMEAFNRMREQMQNGQGAGFANPNANQGTRMHVNTNPKQGKANKADDGEYTDYEEIK